MRWSSIFDDRLSQAGETLAPMAAGGSPGGDPGGLVQPVQGRGVQARGAVVLPVQDRQGRSGAR